MIKFVSDLRQVGGFLRVFFTNKTDRHDITEILLKVALNTITPPKQEFFKGIKWKKDSTQHKSDLTFNFFFIFLGIGIFWPLFNWKPQELGLVEKNADRNSIKKFWVLVSFWLPFILEMVRYYGMYSGSDLDEERP